jgi:hypothetical protein
MPPLRFVAESVVRASAACVFAFHERLDAFALLQPPWAETEIVQPPASLAVGTRVILRTKLGPFWQTLEAERVACVHHGPIGVFTMIRSGRSRWTETRSFAAVRRLPVAEAYLVKMRQNVREAPQRSGTAEHDWGRTSYQRGPGNCLRRLS